MEITVNVRTQKKVEVQLPYYSKTNCHFFKVIAEDKSIYVYDGSSSCGIEQRSPSASCFDEDTQPSNMSEFLAAFARVKDRLTNEAIGK